MKYFCLLWFCLSASAHAEVYKWVDANGKVHYGDRPSSTNARQMEIKSAPSTQSAPDATRKNQQDIDSWLKARGEERRVNQRREAELQREQAIERQKCTELKLELQDLQQGGGVWYDLDATGKRHYYSDKEIALEIAELKKTVKRNCPR